MKKLALLLACIVCISLFFTSCAGPFLFAWMHEGWLIGLEAEEVEYIRVTRSFVGVAPGSLKSHYYIEDSEEVEKYLSGLAWIRNYGSVAMMDGGSSSSALVMLKDGTGHGIVTGGYTSINGSTYRAVGAPEFDREKARITLSFLTYGSNGEIFELNETGTEKKELMGRAIDVGALEFVRSEEPEKYSDVVPTHVIETRFGELFVLGEKVFRYDNGYETEIFELVDGSFYDMLENDPLK